jgi:hypothetical protein
MIVTLNYERKFDRGKNAQVIDIAFSNMLQRQRYSLIHSERNNYLQRMEMPLTW